MRKIYTKLLSLSIFILIFTLYYHSAQNFIEEIEFDNNILRWNNELLEHKKNQIVEKRLGVELYEKVLVELPKRDQILDSIYNIKNTIEKVIMYDFSLNILENESACYDSLCLSYMDIKINFTCNNINSMSLIIENISFMHGIVVQFVNIDNLSQYEVFVNLLLRSYYSQNNFD